MTSPHRLVRELELPPYAHVPGKTPHPVRDPAGHQYAALQEPLDFSLDRWPQCRPYLYGIDLFNHGYYWEAHEAWEQVWLAAGRRGPAADFLKALIKLAAAGVKRREGSARGQRRHARRAAQLLRQVSETLTHRPPAERRMMGLPLDRLAEQAAAAADASEAVVDTTTGPSRVFPFGLVPEFPP